VSENCVLQWASTDAHTQKTKKNYQHVPHATSGLWASYIYVPHATSGLWASYIYVPHDTSGLWASYFYVPHDTSRLWASYIAMSMYSTGMSLLTSRSSDTCYKARAN